MINPSAALAIRIDASVADLLPLLAQKYELTVPLLVERLIVDKADEEGMLAKGDPRKALRDLVAEVGLFLDQNPALAKDPDVTLAVFEAIRTSPGRMKTYERAVAPSKGVRADKRRQFVHQRIGRFVKDHFDLVSVEEVTLPRGSQALIRGYTRLSK